MSQTIILKTPINRFYYNDFFHYAHQLKSDEALEIHYIDFAWLLFLFEIGELSYSKWNKYTNTLE